MKKFSIYALLLIGGLALGYLGRGWFSTSAQNAEHQDHQHGSEEGATTWTCSMHPSVKQNEPGDCPLCGMDLIPMSQAEEDEGIDPESLRMSATAMKLAKVQTAKVQNTPVKGRAVQLSGKIQANERLQQSQSSHIPGRIESLLVSFTGDFVRKGQTIAYVYSPELVTAQAELLQAHKTKAQNPLLFQAAKERLLNYKISSLQIEQILDSGQPQENFPLKADAEGYVSSLLVVEGDYVRGGQALYQVVGLYSVWAMFDVYERDLPWIAIGDTIAFTLASLPGENFKGQVSYIDPKIDPASRVARARVEIKNPGAKLKPEMFASGRLIPRLSTKEEKMSVPKSAVLWTGKRSVVYVMEESQNGVYFQMREVMLGAATEDRYAIVSGLEVGEEIAVNGVFSVDAAAQLSGKPSMMAAPEPKSEAENSQKLALGQAAKEVLVPLFESYLSLKDSLVADNAEGAQQAMAEMERALAKTDSQVFSGDAQKHWEKYAERLKKALNQSDNSNDLAGQREVFQRVSEIMLDMANTFGAPNQKLYVQHCPMADSNKGADWLSTSPQIMNPYFGDSMLRCGEVVKEIAEQSSEGN